MNDFKERPFKLLIRKLPDKEAKPNEVFPFFFDIVLNRTKERRQLDIFIARLKPLYYSTATAAQILSEYLGKGVKESDIEFMLALYHPDMPNRWEYGNPDPIIVHPLWSCKSGLHSERL